MSINTVYVPAKKCVTSSFDAPGTRALMAWQMGIYGPEGARNGGIFNCRYIAGTRVLSLHAEARAKDLMTEAYPSKWGWSLARFLHQWSAELGIQAVIYDRRIWSAAFPYSGFRVLNSSNPHTDHLHEEVTPHSALYLTTTRINLVARMAKTMRLLPTLRRNASAVTYVKNMQSLLNAHGFKLLEDGMFGPATETAVKSFQRQRTIADDGICGGLTWAHLLDVQ